MLRMMIRQAVPTLLHDRAWARGEADSRMLARFAEAEGRRADLVLRIQEREARWLEADARMLARCDAGLARLANADQAAERAGPSVHEFARLQDEARRASILHPSVTA